MNHPAHALSRCFLALLLASLAAPALAADVDATPPTPKGLTGFADIQRWYTARRKEFNEGQARLLQKRYDLSDKAATDGAMFRGKKIQQGVRAKLPAGVSWEDLAKMTPEEIRRRDAFPEGFMPLPHPNHPEGGMLFPRMHIDEIKKQEGRDLERFDLDFDIPEHFLPEFPPAMFLTTRPDLGDVSKGRLVTLDNYYELFDGILNPKQLDGLRLLLTPFPQQQFNATDDRRVMRPSLGVTCFDCHANGGTNGATHLVGDIRPQEFRHRIETPALRGVNVQRLFGSQRALKSIEDFTEFEQRAAYFDGDIMLAAKKGVHVPDRQSQVHHMAELQELLNFPPAPKLGVDGKLIAAKASPAELRGQALFFGKAKCADCHAPPYYTDNTMHDLKVERFYKPRGSRGLMMSADGPIKNFPLRGIKDTPPYLHDGRLLTLDDTVRFFNIVLETRLTPEEEADVTAFMKAL
ncbi:MAG: cytochrome B6 [Elusimicrobia bacterium]|nr:cytochrome B6 [Elusimicrobiota bacterium]